MWKIIQNKQFLILAGIVLFAGFVSLVELDPERPILTYTAGVAILMAFWWVTEAIPIAITSLLPVFLFPFFGVMDSGHTAGAYINHIIFLFIGGFIMALAMEKWDLHRRIALFILLKVGQKPIHILWIYVCRIFPFHVDEQYGDGDAYGADQSFHYEKSGGILSSGYYTSI